MATTQRIRRTAAREVTSNDGHSIALWSYSTPVAFHASNKLPVIAEKRYSVTTTRHVNEWLARHGFTRHNVTTAPESELRTLAATLED